MSEPDDGNGDSAVEQDPNPLQRALDLLVFAPVGIALTVAEDLPGLIGKGHQRFETDVQNARIVGRIVVAQGQRQLVDRVSKLLHRTASEDGSDGSDTTTPTEGADGTPGPTTPSPRTGPSPRPDADPADGIIVEGALAGYDTLSASQVVRRLESLGPDELTALQRYEASHRNRHTILNRAHQILEAIEAAGETAVVTADGSDAVPAGIPADQAAEVAPHETAGGTAAPQSTVPEGGTPQGGTGPQGATGETATGETATGETATGETATGETAVPETVAPTSPPPAATAPEPDRSVE